MKPDPMDIEHPDKKAINLGNLLRARIQVHEIWKRMETLTRINAEQAEMIRVLIATGQPPRAPWWRRLIGRD